MIAKEDLSNFGFKKILVVILINVTVKLEKSLYTNDNYIEVWLKVENIDG